MGVTAEEDLWEFAVDESSVGVEREAGLKRFDVDEEF